MMKFGMTLLLLGIAFLLQSTGFVIYPSILSRRTIIYGTNTLNHVTSQPVSSPTIEELNNEIILLNKTLENLRATRLNEEETLRSLEEEYGDDIRRVKKELESLKERAENEDQLRTSSMIKAVQGLLPVYDNFNRAINFYSNLKCEKEIRIFNAYKEIYSILAKIIQDAGLTRIECVGKPLNYNCIIPVTDMPSEEYGPDIVMLEHEIGYLHGDKCVKPAMVVVSSGPPSN